MVDQKAKILAVVAFILLGLGTITIFQLQNLDKTRLIFCDVGQGDAILITSGTRQILVDGGPGNKILDCLGAKMPFWDREIEMVVLTHPQQDHMEGLLGVLTRYEIATVVTTNVANETQLFGEWQKALASEGARIYEPDVDDQFVVDAARGETLSVLWPSSTKVTEWQADAPSDLNETSIVMRLDTGNSSANRCVYLTGDLPKEILVGLIDRQCEILKISHHGSRTGTDKEILEKAKPRVAVIQVGRNNRFGHPHKEVLDQLVSQDIDILRNDTDGTVEIESDGKSFKIKRDRNQ